MEAATLLGYKGKVIAPRLQTYVDTTVLGRGNCSATIATCISKRRKGTVRMVGNRNFSALIILQDHSHICGLFLPQMLLFYILWASLPRAPEVQESRGRRVAPAERWKRRQRQLPMLRGAAEARDEQRESQQLRPKERSWPVGRAASTLLTRSWKIRKHMWAVSLGAFLQEEAFLLSGDHWGSSIFSL